MMKQYVFIFVLVVLSIFLTISILLTDEREIIVITSPKIYSLIHTENNEQFSVPIMISKIDTYYLNEDYFNQISLKNNQEILPLKLHDIFIREEDVMVDGKSYTLIDMNLSLALTSNDMLIEYEEAYLEIEYTNEKSIKVLIGEFNYGFVTSDNDLSLYNLQGTFGDVNGINTVTGLEIELFNRRDANISILSIDCFSSQVEFNNEYLQHKNRDITLFERPEDILLIDTYNYNLKEQYQNSVMIQSNQSKNLYVPIVYYGDIGYINRFSVVIYYEFEGVTKTLYLDDFIFMNQSNFGSNYESEYQYYVFEE